MSTVSFATVTVSALPVKAPTNDVEVTEVSHASVVLVAPSAMFVDHIVSELLVNLAFASVPVRHTVIEVAANRAVVGDPQRVNVILVSSTLVSAAPPVIDEAAGVIVTSVTAVVNHFALTVTCATCVADQKVPTFALTVASVPVPVTFPVPLNDPLV